MKNLLCLILALLTIPAIAQKKNLDHIIAMKLPKAVAKQYLGKANIKAFSVDKEGILRPGKGYEIKYIEELKKLVVKPQNIKMTNYSGSLSGFDIEKVPGGTMFCMCEGGDDCEVQVSMDGDDSLHYHCSGSCNCGSFIIFDVSTEIRVQTSDFGWSDLYGF